MTTKCPALFITAPASGHGKTSITAALARYFTREGLRVRCFKTGADFIDPTILSMASGRAVYNLDTWMMGDTHCQQLLYEAAANSDLLLIEGAMGLFDGKPSSADLAKRFGVPLLAVIDASAMAQTFAAVLHGLATFCPELVLKNAVANRVASPYHAELVRSAVSKSIRVAAIARNDNFSFPERHLGLQMASEFSDLEKRLDLLADEIEKSDLRELPESVTFYSTAQQQKMFTDFAGKKIAIARDEAFCFLYEKNVECLQELGAKIYFFSPLKDSVLPDVDAVYLVGGYPELHATALSENQPMRAALKHHVEQNKPLFAECGGMLYLSETLIDTNGVEHEMLGILPGVVTMQKKLSALGLQEVTFNQQVFRGHTFHYSTFQTPLTPISNAKSPDERIGEGIYQHGSVVASYVHFYFHFNLLGVKALFPNLANLKSTHSFSTAEQNAIYKAIYERRDMRHFLPKSISSDVLNRLFQAAHHAPSVGFMQPWRFIRVSSQELKAQIYALVEQERILTAQALGERDDEFMKLKVEGILECGEVIVAALCEQREKHIFGRRTLPEMDIASLSCAIQNMWLAARAEGLGLGWVSMFEPEALKTLLKMPVDSKPLAILCLGYVKEFYEKPMLEQESWATRADVADFIFENTWGKS